MHPKLEPLIQSEVKKLLDARIIFKFRHSKWVSNLVPVRKKSGEIRLCIDFRNLNRASDKDNYPVPPMEQLLQMVSSSELFSLLDGFSIYNQMLVAEEDRLKTTFRTKWGTFAYRRMPFVLINAGMTLTDAPESMRQLCMLWLKISNVRRKGGFFFLDLPPMLASPISSSLGWLSVGSLSSDASSAFKSFIYAVAPYTFQIMRY